ncbi:YadA C-terminal domain-containing protein [Edwardsiella anguillarum]|uniref:YadA C-terminal domain-containing protein n=6 Tax=Edwardsiella anguillarum TaxID=1821960 RepID=UPI0024B6CA7A|nr:YadA C-terminal domain-containing protein [Edwardsiella anguillarum]WHQ15505.1 YadA-like family protein [Edwardsiella anguillarum]
MRSVSKVLILSIIGVPFISIAADEGALPVTNDLSTDIATIVNNIVGGLKVTPEVISASITGIANNVIQPINANLGAAGAAIQQNHEGLSAANTEIAAAKGRLDRQQQFDQVTGVTLEANRQQLAAHQAEIAAANANLGAAGAAIQQNHEGLSAANTEIAAAKGRLDRQQQFDQVTGVTLEANRQRLAAHQAEIAAAKGRLDRQQQFDQVTGVTLEANRQRLATHQAEIAAANANLGAAGAAIQQNHEGLSAANTEIAAAKGRLDRQQQFDQVTGVTLEANRQRLATHQAEIAAANANLGAVGAAIQQNHEGLSAANTEIAAAKGRLDRQQQFDQITGVTLEVHRQQLEELNNTVNTSNAKVVQNLSGRMDYLQEWQGMANNRINDLERVTAENRKVSSRGIAGVAAMANIPTPMDGGLSLGIGYGYYDNQNAFAVGASKYFETGVAIKGGVSLTGKYAVVGAGASFSFK